MKQKNKVRENSEYAKVPVFQWFFLLERLPLMDAKAAINGIQEVSGSIPLISTKNTRFHLKSSVFYTFQSVLCWAFSPWTKKPKHLTFSNLGLQYEHRNQT